jgi:hypothetical protein
MTTNVTRTVCSSLRYNLHSVSTVCDISCGSNRMNNPHVEKIKYLINKNVLTYSHFKAPLDT